METGDMINMTPGEPSAETKLKTAEDVKDLYTRAKVWSRDWHSNIDRWRKLYDLNHYDTPALAGEHRYSDPTPTNTVDLSVGILLANEIEWKAIGWSPNPDDEKKTAQVEKYLAGLLQSSSEREEVYIHYEVEMHFARDGAGVIYCVWDNDLAEMNFKVVTQADETSPEGTRPIGAYMEPPLRTQVIDPLQMYLIPGGPKRWLCAIRVQKISVFDVEMQYSVQIPKYSGVRTEQKHDLKGELRDCWRFVKKNVPMMMGNGEQVFNRLLGQVETTSKYVVQQALLFDDEVIWPFRDMEGYEDLPFTIGFFKPVYRDQSSGWGHSIIKPMESTLTLLERLTNRRTRQVDLYTNLPVITRSPTGKSVKLDAVFGETVGLTADETIEFVAWPGNAPDLELELQFLRARLQQSGFADVMFASGQQQVAGYALNQMTDQNRIRLEQPVKHLEMLWSSWAKKAMHLTAHFAKGSVVRVYGRLKGKDFAEQVIGDDLDQFLIRARIRPKFPNDEVRKTAMATQAKPFLPIKIILERFFDIEQPDDIYDEWLIEQAQRHPAMLEYGARAALMEMAAAGDAAAAMTLEAMQAQAIGGQQGRPPEPSAPEQLLGMASPTGQETPQAGGAPPPGQSSEDQMVAATEQAPGMMG